MSDIIPENPPQLSYTTTTFGPYPIEKIGIWDTIIEPPHLIDQASNIYWGDNPSRQREPETILTITGAG